MSADGKLLTYDNKKSDIPASITCRCIALLLFVIGCWLLETVNYTASPTDRFEKVLRLLKVLRFNTFSRCSNMIPFPPSMPLLVLRTTFPPKGGTKSLFLLLVVGSVVARMTTSGKRFIGS